MVTPVMELALAGALFALFIYMVLRVRKTSMRGLRENE